MSNEVTNIEHLRSWLRDCPALSKKNRFRVDYLSESPTEYALYSVPTTIAYRENVLGEEVPREIQTLDFILLQKSNMVRTHVKMPPISVFMTSLSDGLPNRIPHEIFPKSMRGR